MKSWKTKSYSLYGVAFFVPSSCPIMPRLCICQVVNLRPSPPRISLSERSDHPRHSLIAKRACLASSSTSRKKTLFPKPHQSHIILPSETLHHPTPNLDSRSARAMLASPFYHAQQQTPQSYHQREFLPKIPSPLSPRSANIHGNGTARPIFMSDDLSKPQSPSPVPYAKRAIKRAPVVSQDALKERRRGMFLKKVREGREDKRFEKHGEDVSITL